MTEQEIIEFCERREVEIFTRFNPETRLVTIKMRKGNLVTESTFSPDIARTRSGFGLTIRFVLRGMADDLDKEAKKNDRV